MTDRWKGYAIVILGVLWLSPDALLMNAMDSEGDLWADGVAQFMAGDAWNARATSFAEQHAHLDFGFAFAQ